MYFCPLDGADILQLNQLRSSEGVLPDVRCLGTSCRADLGLFILFGEANAARVQNDPPVSWAASLRVMMLL